MKTPLPNGVTIGHTTADERLVILGTLRTSSLRMTIPETRRLIEELTLRADFHSGDPTVRIVDGYRLERVT